MELGHEMIVRHVRPRTFFAARRAIADIAAGEHKGEWATSAAKKGVDMVSRNFVSAKAVE